MKPCPFCGGIFTTTKEADELGIYMAEVCDRCGASGPKLKAGDGLSARQAWDERAEIDPSEHAYDSRPPVDNNRNAEPQLPIVGGNGRIWCPACQYQINRKRPPERCPECLQRIVKPEPKQC